MTANVFKPRNILYVFHLVSLGHADYIHDAEPCVLDFAAGLAHDFFEQNFTHIADEIAVWGNNSKEYVQQMCIQPPDVIRGYLGQINAVSFHPWLYLYRLRTKCDGRLYFLLVCPPEERGGSGGVKGWYPRPGQTYPPSLLLPSPLARLAVPSLHSSQASGTLHPLSSGQGRGTLPSPSQDRGRMVVESGRLFGMWSFFVTSQGNSRQLTKQTYLQESVI